MKAGCAVAVLVGACLAGSVSGAADRVRVYAARPDCFEYMFASIASGSDTASPLLSFNNLRTGRTTFARVGEKVGNYEAVSFEPRTETVFNEGLNREETRKSGVAVLADSFGQKFILDMGIALTNDSFVAWLVDLDNGNSVQVRPGDTISFGGITQRIDAVSLDKVMVSIDDEPAFIKIASEEDRASLARTWAKQREAWEEAKKRSDELARKEAEAREEEAMRAAFLAAASQSGQTASPPTRRPPSTQISVVTEYRYPTDYEIIPPIYDSRGNMIRPLMVIPRNFVTRPVGVTMGGGVSSPVLQDSRGGSGGTTTFSVP